MPLYTALPLIAAGAFLLGTIFLALRSDTPMRHAWIVPAVLSGLFLAWSIYTVAVEGPLGFWFDHTRNAWGNQVWFDLLLGIGIAWSFIVPEAKRHGMRPLPWLLFVACTGCIGLLAMTARYLFLREKEACA